MSEIFSTKMSSVDKFLLKQNDENVEIPMVCRLCGIPVKSLTLFTPGEYEYGDVYTCLLYEIHNGESYFLCEQCIHTTKNIACCMRLLHSSRCLNKKNNVVGCFMCGSGNCNIFFVMNDTEVENIVLDRFLDRFGFYAKSTQRICISCNEVFSDLVEIHTVLRDNIKRSKAKLHTVQESETMLVSKPIQKDTKRVTVCSTYNELNKSSEFMIFPFEEGVEDVAQSNQKFRLDWNCTLTPRDNQSVNQLDSFDEETSSSSKFIVSPLKETGTSNENIVPFQQFDNQDQTLLSLQFQKEIESAAFYVPRRARTSASNITTAQLPKILEECQIGLQGGDNPSTEMASAAFHASRKGRSSSSNITPDQLPKILEENPSALQGGDAVVAGPTDVPLNKYSSKYSISPLQIGSKRNTPDETTILDIVTGWRMPRSFFSGKPSVSDYAYLSTKSTSLDKSSFASLPEDIIDSSADPIASTSKTSDKEEDLNDGTEPSTCEKGALSTNNSLSVHSKIEVIAKSSSVDQLILPSLKEIQSFIPRALFIGSLDTLSDASMDVANKKQDLLPTDSNDEIVHPASEKGDLPNNKNRSDNSEVDFMAQSFYGSPTVDQLPLPPLEDIERFVPRALFVGSIDTLPDTPRDVANFIPDKKQDLIPKDSNDEIVHSVSERSDLPNNKNRSNNSEVEFMAQSIYGSRTIEQSPLPSLEEIQSFIPRALFTGAIDTLSDASMDEINKKRDLLPPDSDDEIVHLVSEKGDLPNNKNRSDNSEVEFMAQSIYGSRTIEQPPLPSLEEIQSFIPRALFIGAIDTLSDASMDEMNKKQDLLATDSNDDIVHPVSKMGDLPNNKKRSDKSEVEFMAQSLYGSSTVDQLPLPSLEDIQRFVPRALFLGSIDTLPDGPRDVANFIPDEKQDLIPKDSNDDIVHPVSKMGDLPNNKKRSNKSEVEFMAQSLYGSPTVDQLPLPSLEDIERFLFGGSIDTLPDGPRDVANFIPDEKQYLIPKDSHDEIVHPVSKIANLPNNKNRADNSEVEFMAQSIYGSPTVDQLPLPSLEDIERFLFGGSIDILPDAPRDVANFIPDKQELRPKDNEILPSVSEDGLPNNKNRSDNSEVEFMAQSIYGSSTVDQLPLPSLEDIERFVPRALFIGSIETLPSASKHITSNIPDIKEDSIANCLNERTESSLSMFTQSSSESVVLPTELKFNFDEDESSSD